MKQAVRYPVLSMLLSIALLSAAAAPKPSIKLHRVAIRNLKYEPAKITIKVGEAIQWVNEDDHDHTVVAKDESFESDNLGRDDAFRRVFTKPGKFEYFCRYHPRMKGTVTVEK